jgi:hypothetical protein
MFHADTKQLEELWFCVFLPLHSWTAGGKTKYSGSNAKTLKAYFYVAEIYRSQCLMLYFGNASL